MPHHLVKHQLELQASRDGIALFLKGQQVARHARSVRQGGYSTDSAHMPQAHRKQDQWSPGRLMSWAKDIGPHVLQLVKLMLERKAHPEQAYRACLGLLNLSKTYDAKRLDHACQRAMIIGSPNLKSIKSILKQGLDQLALPLDEQDKDNTTSKTLSNDHSNIRGPEYYH